MAMFRLAKREGCPGFRDSRVFFGEFLVWWGNRGGEDAHEDWGKALKREQTLRTRQLREKEAGRLMDADLVADGIAKGMATVFSELEREFCDKFPAVAKGLGESEIRAGASATIERIKTRLRETWSGPGAFQQTEQKL